MNSALMNVETATHNIAQAVLTHYLSSYDGLKFDNQSVWEALSADLEDVVEVYESTYKAVQKIFADRAELEEHEMMENKELYWN